MSQASAARQGMARTSAAQPAAEGAPIGNELDGAALQTRIGQILNRWPAVGLAVAVIRDGRLTFFDGHGLADIASGSRMTEDTVFRVASISKTFTAIAVMQLCEQGLIDLDAPANAYLRAFQLIPADSSFPPATVRHLLTHTAGIPEVLRASDLLRPDWGDSVPLGTPIPSLAEFYGLGIPLVTAPGTNFAYTNHAFAALQQIVEDVSGMSYAHYLRLRIFTPLGMVDTDIVRAERLTGRLATGYVLGARGPEPVVDREWVTAGASSIYSTLRDMARYVTALLGGGSNRHGSILKPATLASMFDSHYRPDPRIPGMGLGFDRNDTHGHRVVGHGGILPGFNSQMFVAPDDGVGIVAFTNGARRAMLWLPTETGRLLNQVLGVPDDAIREDVPQRPETWPELCGWYFPQGSKTDVRARLMLGAGARVHVRGDRLRLRVLSPIPALYRGFDLHPDDEADPYAFRIDLAEFGLPQARILFSHAPDGNVAGVHLDLFPMSLRKRPAHERAWARRARMPLLVAGAALGIALLGRRPVPVRSPRTAAP